MILWVGGCHNVKIYGRKLPINAKQSQVYSFNAWTIMYIMYFNGNNPQPMMFWIGGLHNMKFLKLIKSI